MSRKILLFLFLSLCSAASMAQSLLDGRYAIVSRHSGLALDVAGASGEDGANVQQWGYDGGDWQHFDVVYQGDGYYSIRPVHSGKSLDVYGWSSEPGGEIRQWSYQGADNQLWAIAATDSGYFTIRSKFSGLNLDVWGWSEESGGDIRQFTPDGGYNQQFRFVRANDGETTVENGRYAIVSRHSGLALDVTGGSNEDGANIQQWGYGGGAWQQFDVTYQGNGYYSIRAAHSGKSVDVADMSLEAGTSIVQWSYWGGDGQLWSIQPVDSGFYTITSKLNGMALDVWEWSTENGGDIRQYTAWGGEAQQFGFTSTVAGSSESADGFASRGGGTTGGGSASPVTVNSCSELASAVSGSGAKVIQISNSTIDCRVSGNYREACPIDCGDGKMYHRVPVGSQSCTELGSSNNNTETVAVRDTRINVGSNTTIVGLGANSRVLGGSFNLGDASNVILRNFTIEDINPGLVEAGDAVTLSGSSNIWVDHMRTNLISDGHVDINSSQNVTLSWNHFMGYNPQVCGNQHHYTNGVGESQVTFHHNFWDTNSGRNPRLSGSSTNAHIYNNYWLDITYFSINTSDGAQAKVEGNYFANSSRPHWNESGYMDANIASNRYTGRSATDSERDTGDSVFAVPYSYSLDNVDNLPAVLSSQTGPQ
ncbi:RICIN domain-containing protein [Microbulbifer mangrovi]|uniref:RICIN domain-containing protein n=1 Tax=Microbulbifer mangrovi TaxID=927787 RepID=UPI001300F032|nr:RICIN domain-containing protein [Microbulbifer mangrovi]